MLNVGDILELPDGFIPNGEARPRRKAEVLKILGPLSRGRPPYSKIRYLDTGEELITVVREDWRVDR